MIEAVLNAAKANSHQVHGGRPPLEMVGGKIMVKTRNVANNTVTPASPE